MTDLPEVDDILDDDDDENEGDGFFVTGTIVVQAGLAKDGELQWRWKYDDIEPALVLGFLEVMKDEVKEDIRASVKREDEDEI